MPARAARHRHALLAVVLGSALGGCAGTPPGTTERPAHAASPGTPAGIRTALEEQLEAWRGTPYEWGGMSRDGIDCSGFVYRTYRDRLGIEVPRTTAAQTRVGARVARSALRPGDLVFFRTGAGKRHVGIALGDGSFIHASTRVGVTVSHLDNRYWRRHYYRAVRPAALNGNGRAADARPRE